MVRLLIFILFIPNILFAQDLELSTEGCWKEYKIEPKTSGLTEDHCPFILCPDGTLVCHVYEDNEMFSLNPGWKKLDEVRIQIGENENNTFKIILWNEQELIIESEMFPGTRIYFKK